MSSPIETADVAVDADSVQPLVTSLTYMKGAGVVIHDRFTILFFLPSNNQLKYAFKLPAMKNYPKLKIYLRLVVLPPLDVPVPVKAMLERAKPITSPLDSGFDWYHHNLLHRSTGVKFDEIIERDKENMRRMRDSGMFFVFYCPPNVQLEQMEISHAIALYNKKVLKIDEIPGFLDGSRGPLRLTVMIHQSLRRQLHLLPHINRLRNKTNFQFHLFGTKVEGNRVLTNQLRIWPLGAVIFITPRLATSFPDVLDHILNYQRLKSTTTKLALPSNWEPQFMETLEMNGQAKR